jgi:hypothetical protein
MIMQQQEQQISSTSNTDKDIDVETGGPHASKVSLDEDTASEVPAGSNCGGAQHRGYNHEEDSVSLRSYTLLTHRWLAIFVLLFLLIVGAAASVTFLFLGITSAREGQNDLFVRRSSELVKEIQNAFKDYEVAGQWEYHSRRIPCPLFESD